MSLNPDEIRQILAAIEKSDWDEALITVGDTSIAVSRNGATLPSAVGAPRVEPVAVAPQAVTPTAPIAAAPVPAPVAAPAPAPVVGPVAAPSEGVEVTSPTVGIFWRSPRPGEPPFVEIGGQVEIGDVLCIVEVMKLMNNVTSPVAGTVAAVHVDNSTAVEFGQVLLTIVPKVN